MYTKLLAELTKNLLTKFNHVQTEAKENKSYIISRWPIINGMICNLSFQIENGLKVHMDLVHLIPPDMDYGLNCKYCLIDCSDLDALKTEMRA